MPTPNLNPGQGLLSTEQIHQRAFDETKDRIRTDAEFSGTISGDITVEIDAATGDNISLNSPDGSKPVSVTTVGGKNGLDVNLVDNSVRVTNALITEPFDYIAATYPSSTVEVYTYRTGGSGGSLVGVITVTYTDATKDFIASVAKV